MDITEPTQQMSAPPVDLVSWDWQAELKRQDRRIPWLARQTERSESAVRKYAAGVIPTPPAWLATAARVLGVEVATNA
jgi:hypothetical protein